MERYEALEILRLYEHDDVTGVNGESAAEIYRNRNKLVLKAQELLLSDEERGPICCGSEDDEADEKEGVFNDWEKVVKDIMDNLPDGNPTQWYLFQG